MFVVFHLSPSNTSFSIAELSKMGNDLDDGETTSNGERRSHFFLPYIRTAVTRHGRGRTSTGRRVSGASESRSSASGSVRRARAYQDIVWPWQCSNEEGVG